MNVSTLSNIDEKGVGMEKHILTIGQEAKLLKLYRRPVHRLAKAGKNPEKRS